MKRWFLLGWILPILLLGLTACGGRTPSANGETPPSVIVVHITLTDLTIESSLPTFSKDVPYRFMVTNTSSQEHEFLLGPLIQPGMTMADVEQQKLFGFAVIPIGATASADWTFKNIAAEGVWQFSCHKGELYEAGMRLDVVVR